MQRSNVHISPSPVSTPWAPVFHRHRVLVAVSITFALLTTTSAQESTTASTLPVAATPESCRQYLQADNNQAAVSAANIALARRDTNDNPDARFIELVCRGKAYVALAETRSAERDFREALRLASRHFDPFDVRLVDPLTYLGRSRLAATDSAEAELLLLQARDITHRNAGIFNVEQKELLDDLTEVFMQQGRSRQANRQQQLRLRSAREAYGETPELVDALHDFARWNALKQDFPKVRVTLEEAVSILEGAYGVNDPRLIATLKLRAQLYKLHPTISTPKAGEKAMQRVVDIYSTQEFVDQVDLLKARTDMGDWYLQGFRSGKALRYYKKTIKNAMDEHVPLELIDRFYGAPELIFIDAVKQSFFTSDESGEQQSSGVIRFRYSVGANGKTRNIRLLEDTLSNEAVTEEVIKRVETAVFRPRYVNGKAVITHNVEQRFDIKQTASGLEISKIHAPVLIK